MLASFLPNTSSRFSVKRPYSTMPSFLCLPIDKTVKLWILICIFVIHVFMDRNTSLTSQHTRKRFYPESYTWWWREEGGGCVPPPCLNKGWEPLILRCEIKKVASLAILLAAVIKSKTNHKHLHNGIVNLHPLFQKPVYLNIYSIQYTVSHNVHILLSSRSGKCQRVMYIRSKNLYKIPLIRDAWRMKNDNDRHLAKVVFEYFSSIDSLHIYGLDHHHRVS